MAKSQLRGNREAKKPKQPKKVPSPASDSWTTAAKNVSAGAAAKKK